MLTTLWLTFGFCLGLSYLCGVNTHRKIDWIDCFTLMAWTVLWPFMLVAEVGNRMGELLKQYEE